MVGRLQHKSEVSAANGGEIKNVVPDRTGRSWQSEQPKPHHSGCNALSGPAGGTCSDSIRND